MADPSASTRSGDSPVESAIGEDTVAIDAFDFSGFEEVTPKGPTGPEPAATAGPETAIEDGSAEVAESPVVAEAGAEPYVPTAPYIPAPVEEDDVELEPRFENGQV